MATITKRKGRIVIEWDKDAPTDLRYFHEAEAVVSDDSEPGGEKVVRVRFDNTGTRTTFRALTGQQIEDDWKAKTDAALQALGSGAGGHSIVQDWGS
jgi:hypothetical protein